MSTLPVIPILVNLMTYNEIVIVEMQTTLWTHKRISVWNRFSLNFLLDFRSLLHPFSRFFFLNHFGKNIWSFFATLPNAAHLQDGSELGPLKFINEVVDFVWTLHKLWVSGIDSNLDLTVDLVVEFGIDQNVIGW